MHGRMSSATSDANSPDPGLYEARVFLCLRCSSGITRARLSLPVTQQLPAIARPVSHSRNHRSAPSQGADHTMGHAPLADDDINFDVVHGRQAANDSSILASEFLAGVEVIEMEIVEVIVL